MKDFLKYTFATICGIFIATIIMTVMGIASLVGMMASEESTKSVEDNSVFVLSLNGTIEERAADNPLSAFLGGGPTNNMGLDDIQAAIRKAAENDQVKGIYIEANQMFSADSHATLLAVRRALQDFKKSGKWIVAYGDLYTQASYYLCSVADKIYLNPEGEVDLHGLASQPMFYKDLMAKFGVKMQLAKVGTYKSAPEMYTADKMSDPNREQVTRMLNVLWGQMVADIAKSRKVSADSVNAWADRMIALEPATNLLRYKLVDKLLFADEMRAEMKKRIGIKDDETIKQLSLADMKNVPSKKEKGDNEIAVYYAVGSIVNESVENTVMGGGDMIVAKDVCNDLEKLAKDDDVKAVVLRINSPGGSAYASEQLYHAIMNLKAKKPVVVSMGGMAASGGYYMSAPASWIVAEPTTLTGSIGIFGMFPDFSELLTQKLGVKFDEVKTNRNSGFGTMARPFNAEEMACLNRMIQRGYKLFRQRVSEGRKMKEEEVETVAQGHVFIGKDALGIKLVDQLGGLDDAVKKAAELAKIKDNDYYTSAQPSTPSFLDQIMSTVAGGNYLDEQVKAVMGEYYEPFKMLKTMSQQDAIQARIPIEFNIR